MISCPVLMNAAMSMIGIFAHADIGHHDQFGNIIV